jgi:hypothetical protein
MNKIKGNPVPSIDKLKLQFDKEKNSELWSYDSNTHLENFITFVNKLENGVETNKEQPKCECKHGSSCDNSCMSVDEIVRTVW